MLHVIRKMVMWKAKSIFNEKNDDPAIKDLFVVVDDVKSLCEDMGTLVEEKLQLLRRIHRIWLIVS